MLRTFHASGFLGSLAPVLLHSTRLCELPKRLKPSLMCRAGRAYLFYQKTTWKGLCFWISGLVSFCSSSLQSPLRITKNPTLTDHVCGRLNQDLLAETMEPSFHGSRVSSSLPSILLQHTRLSRSTKSDHHLPMCGSVETKQKESGMSTCFSTLALCYF